jgi:hypothetical protein
MGILYSSQDGGRGLVSDEFNQMCVDARVEARVQGMSNPGDPYHAMRIITFRNFSDVPATVTQYDKRKQIHVIPAKGELQVMLAPDEDLPLVQRGNNG